MRLRTALAAAMLAPLALGGCATTRTTVTEIVTDPPGFEVAILGFGTCVSPCRVEIDRPRRVEIVRAGYFAERFEIRPGQKRVDVRMRLVAPTTDVSSGALPDLK